MIPGVDVARAERAIIHLAKECEECCRHAAFADSEPSLGAGMATSFRKLATISSESAFNWSRTLVRLRGAV